MEHQCKQHYATVAVATVTDMIDSKVFGPDSLFVSFILDKWHTKQNQFSSVVLYGTMTISHQNCLSQSHPLVFKFKHLMPDKREFCRNDQQFHNEKLFYSQIKPFLLGFASQKDGDCPTMPSLCRYFYGRNDCGDLADRDLIVLENETVRGYRSLVTDHPLILDFDHLAMALKTLAKFHGLSYRAKHMDRVKFMEMVAMVEDTQFNSLKKLVERTGKNQFQKELLGRAMKTLERVMEPDEPLSVLCHGDFGRHNLLFRYDDDGRPLDALAYDMALIRYGSPALDLSYFMYLNMDRQARDDHWDELLDVYCETLASMAGSAPVPDRSQLDAEMRKHAYFGAAFASFESRIVLADHEPFDFSKNASLTADEAQHILLACGGKRATEWTADIIQHYSYMTNTDKVAD